MPGAAMNRIVEVKLTLLHEEWKIEVTKEFAPEYGGGSQVFNLSGGPQIHEALRRAAEMVTLTPAYNQQATVWCGRCDTHHRTSELPGACPRREDRDPPSSYDYDSDGNPRRTGGRPYGS